ncbi:hypothetical protein AB0F88_42645 [Streptosporangium sp. NPDC023963]|uniref:hypothetical protein n=1 Tax=Streptosporangium sp. NPDC023963 TaxID=3155608 RepID=UPI00342BBAA3
MKRILLPAGGAILATGLLAAGLAGTANAVPDWAYDTMAKDAPSAVDVAEFWLAANGETNNLAKATPYTWETKATPTLNVGGGYAPDGKPGIVAPIGEEKKTVSKVKNINLPKSIGKVFFVDDKNQLKWCSATSIQSKYRNLVATAGHCVYDDKANASVADNWVFVPGYYQGKTPWGIYVGKTAYTHYDFANYEDYDRDYAFVTVYNGVQIGGGTGKAVTKDEYDKFVGPKVVKTTEISKTQYEECKDFNGKETSDCYAKEESSQVLVGPDWKEVIDGKEYKAVKVQDEVTKAQYEAAPSGVGQGYKDYTVTEHVTKAVYDAYTGPGYRKIDAVGNYTITHYYLEKWVKETKATKYLKDTFIIVEGFIKDAGKLGDNVGGQGFTWNQKPEQTVFAFGYPADAHPDGNKAYTGVTPKWTYGKTTGKTYVQASSKVEEHVGLKSSFTPGADGGPWLAKYSNAKRLGYVNGVTSLFGDQDKNGRYDLITSPYFDGETAAIYTKAAAVWSGSIVK